MVTLASVTNCRVKGDVRWMNVSVRVSARSEDRSVCHSGLASAVVSSTVRIVTAVFLTLPIVYMYLCLTLWMNGFSSQCRRVKGDVRWINHRQLGASLQPLDDSSLPCLLRLLPHLCSAAKTHC